MVPSLVSLCLCTLSRYPDQLPVLSARLRHRPELNDIDPLSLDAKAWATLIQLYDSLPACLSTFSLPLHDPDMPLLQSISSSPQFTLITVLKAPACRALSDDSLVHLKALHTLTALDVSENASITSHGLIAFASTLHLDAGPWPLRILRLRNCPQVTSAVYPHLSKFPLLSVVDLRGTKCSPSVPPPQGFSPNASPLLFHPRSLSECLSHLSDLCPNLHSSPNAFTLLVNELKPNKPATQGLICHDNTVVTISPNDSRLYLDNANAIARRVEAREELARHNENSAEWHRRRELLELSKDEYEEMYPLLAIRREVLASTRSDTLAGPSRIASEPTSLSNLPSGFQPISRSRPTSARPTNNFAAPRASANISCPAYRNVSPPRYSSRLPSGFRPLPSTSRLPSTSAPSPLPPAPQSRSSVTPNDIRSTTQTSTRPSRPSSEGVSRPVYRNVPPHRLPSRPLSGSQSLPPTSLPPASSTAPSLPPTPNSRSPANPHGPSLPAGSQSTKSTRPSPAVSQRPRPSAPPRQGVQNPLKPPDTPKSLWVDPADEPLMLSRPPPPYSTLHSAQAALRASEAERRDAVKRNVQVRAADIAHVDREGKRAVEVRERMGMGLLGKRKEVREVFGLKDQVRVREERMVTATPMPSTNPFKRRATTTSLDQPAVSATSKEREQTHELIPLSKVPTPLFTQDLLDASAKENKKAGLATDGIGSNGQTSKKQKRSSLPSTLAAPLGSKGSIKSKKPRASEGGGSGSTLDLRKWLVPK